MKLKPITCGADLISDEPVWVLLKFNRDYSGTGARITAGDPVLRKVKDLKPVTLDSGELTVEVVCYGRGNVYMNLNLYLKGKSVVDEAYVVEL